MKVYTFKQKGVMLAVCTFLSILIIAFLYISSNTSAHKNGFKRNIISSPILAINKLKLKYNSYYIAGVSSNRFYFGNYMAPGVILSTNHLLSDSHRIIINFQDTISFIQGSPRVFVDSPNIYITDGRTGAILHGTIQQLVVHKKENTNLFFSAAPISPNTYILRTYDPKSTVSILAKKIIGDTILKKAPQIIKKQVDGIFSTDGILAHNSKINKLTFIYYYRNVFVYTDTNLKIIRTGRTIDTNSIAKIHLSRIKSKGTITTSKPPQVINRLVTLSDSFMLINSRLKGDNEIEEVFKNCSVIDIYSIPSGKYISSFYIPDYDGQKITDLRVQKNLLLVLFEDMIETFNLTKLIRGGGSSKL